MASGDMEVTGETKELSQLRMVQRPDWNGFDRVWEEKTQQQIQTTLSGNNAAKGNQKYGETGGKKWINLFFNIVEIIACLFAD